MSSTSTATRSLPRPSILKVMPDGEIKVLNQLFIGSEAFGQLDPVIQGLHKYGSVAQVRSALIEVATTEHGEPISGKEVSDDVQHIQEEAGSLRGEAMSLPFWGSAVSKLNSWERSVWELNITTQAQLGHLNRVCERIQLLSFRQEHHEDRDWAISVLQSCFAPRNVVTRLTEGLNSTNEGEFELAVQGVEKLAIGKAGPRTGNGRSQAKNAKSAADRALRQRMKGSSQPKPGNKSSDKTKNKGR